MFVTDIAKWTDTTCKSIGETVRSNLYLTQQTFVALTDDTLVFLDLHRDKYSCLERKHTKPIAALLGLHAASDMDREEVNSAADQNMTNVHETVQSLIDSGLATRDPEQGKPAELITQHSELKEMLGYEIGEAPKIHAGHLFNFFKALIATKSMLRFASMERIVMRVKRRKVRFQATDDVAPDTGRINELVEIYKILKPLFVTVKDECLFNSLFLIEFLACYRVYPNWYFGVRLNEFYAHCWVQGGNVIYDDFIVKTSENQPIMAV